MGVYTDPTVSKLDCFRLVMDSLSKEGVNFEVYDQCRVEPTDHRSEERTTKFQK